MDLQSYQEAFLGSQQEGMEMLKAMQAGAITGRETTDVAGLTMEPLKIESLEATIRSLEVRNKDFKLYNLIPKLTAYNTVEEFLQLVSIGTTRGGFYNEGELSDVEDSNYMRKSEQIKYMQVTGEVTVQAQMVKSFVDAMRSEIDNKSKWIMKRTALALTDSDSDIISQEWNSLYKQHASIGSTGGSLYGSLDAYYNNNNVVVDLRGASLKQTHVEDAAVAIDDNYGDMDTLVGPPKVISALGKDYYNDQRILMDGKGFAGTIGTTPKAIATTMGDANLISDKFMKTQDSRTTASAATSTKAPTAPTAGGAPSALAVDASAKFSGSGEVGSAFYAVSAINRYGESAITQLGTALVLVAGSSVDLQFTATAGAYAPQAYQIYRTLPGVAAVTSSTPFYPIFKVSLTDLANGYDGAAATKVRDRGRILPNMETAFLTEMKEEVLSLKQLAPVSKLDLAVISMSRRFIAFTFATPQLYMPRKFIKFINVSKTLTS